MQDFAQLGLFHIPPQILYIFMSKSSYQYETLFPKT